ncbi:MAG: UDP-N-acetylmuramoyl-tripeptide--D-alanyl-D-alanine ligase [Oligoflexus sp.]
MRLEITAATLQKELGFEVGNHCHIPANLPNLIATDSRQIQDGQWFWPIIGENFNGHEFIEQAMAKGACGFTYQKDQAARIGLTDDLRAKGMAVSNSLQGLQDLARFWRKLATNTKIFGITGSSGKTTAKQVLAHTLQAIAPTLSTRSSFNNEIGVPLTLCALTHEHHYAVVEMGARHAGDIRFLCDIAIPDVALLLNVGVAHLGEFGSLKTLRQTKLEIFTSTPTETVAVCPSWDQELLQVAKETHSVVVSFGPNVEASVQLLQSKALADGRQLVELMIDGKNFDVTLPFYHESLPINVCAILACGYAMHLPIEDMLASLASFRGVPRRFEIHRNANRLIIDDSYNANPESMLAGLRSLQKGFAEYEKILILGDMLELGTESAQSHRDIGKVCQEIAPKLLVTVGKESLHISQSAKEHGMDASKICHYENVEELRQRMNNIFASGNLIYVKASNGIKLYKVVDDLAKLGAET